MTAPTTCTNGQQSPCRQGASRYDSALLGPAPTIGKALALVEEAEWIDGAVVYINLQASGVLAGDLLKARKRIPFVFGKPSDGSSSLKETCPAHGWDEAARVDA